MKSQDTGEGERRNSPPNSQYMELNLEEGFATNLLWSVMSEWEVVKRSTNGRTRGAAKELAFVSCISQGHEGDQVRSELENPKPKRRNCQPPQKQIPNQRRISPTEGWTKCGWICMNLEEVILTLTKLPQLTCNGHQYVQGGALQPNSECNHNIKSINRFLLQITLENINVLGDSNYS